jgi:hypothetical protein
MKAFPWLLPLADVCINLMLVFAVLLRLSVAASQSAHVESKTSTSTHALYFIKVEWNSQSEDDVDTYVRDPLQHLVFFKRLNDGLMHLDHDDTGVSSNTVTLPSGEKVVAAFNSETVEINGVIPGEWIANIQLYSDRDSKPVSVDVELDKVAGGSSVKVHDETVVLKERGDEQTAFRFTLLPDGAVVDVNRMQTRFVGTKATGI